MIYTFVSFDRSNNVSSGIDDSRALASVVGKKSPKNAMRILAFNVLKEEEIRLPERQFGWSR